ncbi:hypothetical protein ERO13_D07G129550v2 [Gossypium hirsutum]|uniref:Uncharacterized protein n=1 Tax=Gossypium darwinii TaxID=34276 RepID=A0A5D2C0Y3_GOSDA|nr:hypothetical protein ERO13_D07G129550v2 [Gossypium hirsutum]TYG61436.1 hypothetical protein ES288_D07G148200v1 [Gossypium darwinii]
MVRISCILFNPSSFRVRYPSEYEERYVEMVNHNKRVLNQFCGLTSAEVPKPGAWKK